ncbi:hypothetical protein EGH22_08710 [Halomicroarcula sp. F28]|uniref:hypothetical protein n=1 Tax=Haloarcula salinisoli TaxID=2487746 RepID=UPI001C72DFFF|nr:hypothetical protein [Halomicroarcula salinisoli]MBX0286406.1 hypothetical protein [Halomicroarcula salinisoli]
MPDERDDPPDSSRRRLLAGLATAGGAALAGCTTLPAFGQQVRFGSVDEPETGQPSYRDWIPTQDRSDELDGFRTSVEYLEPGSRGSELLGTPYGGTGVKPGMDHVGVDLSAFEWAVEARGSVVAKGAVETETIETALDGTGYDQYDSYEEYTIYERDDLQRVLAHGDDYVLFSGYIDEPMQFIEPMIDAGAGRQTRLHEAQSQFERFTDSVGAPPWAHITPGFFTVDGSEAVMEARTVDFGDSTVYPGRAFLFEEDADVSDQGIRDRISEYPEALEANRVEVAVDGTVATAVAKMPPDTFRSLDNVALYDQPIITWGLGWDPGDSTAVLSHEAGDSVDAELFTVYLRDLTETASDGTPRPQGPDPADDQFSESHERIGPGDSLLVDVSDLSKWQLSVRGEPTDGDYSWSEFAYIPPSLVDL